MEKQFKHKEALIIQAIISYLVHASVSFWFMYGDHPLRLKIAVPAFIGNLAAMVVYSSVFGVLFGLLGRRKGKPFLSGFLWATVISNWIMVYIRCSNHYGWM